MELQENKVVKENGESLLLYKTHGTCSQYIEVGVKEGRVTRCRFYGGCDGNTKGLAQLVVGMKTEDVIARLEGVRCGMKRTSCPDQLCCALRQATEESHALIASTTLFSASNCLFAPFTHTALTF